MKAFDLQCFASQQPIVIDDKLYLLPILQRRAEQTVRLDFGGQEFFEDVHAGEPGSQDLWTPAGNFIEAFYRGRGEFVLLGTEANLANILEFFAQVHAQSAQAQGIPDSTFDFRAFVRVTMPKALPLFAGKTAGQARDTAFEPLPEGLDVISLWSELAAGLRYVFNGMLNREVFITDARGHLCPANFAVMQAPAYDTLAKFYAGRHIEGKSMALRAFFDRALEAARKALADGLEQREHPIFGVVSDQAVVEQFLFNDGFWLALENVQGATLRPWPRSVKASLLRAYHAKELNADELFDCLEPGLRCLYVQAGLKALTVALRPVVTMPTSNPDLGSEYARFIDQVSKQVSAERIPF